MTKFSSLIFKKFINIVYGNQIAKLLIYIYSEFSEKERENFHFAENIHQ